MTDEAKPYRTMAELAAAFDARPPPCWERDKDGVCLTEEGQRVRGWGGEYFIDKKRIDTAAKVAVWAHHLAEKTWMTRECMGDFLHAALNGIRNVPWGC